MRLRKLEINQFCSFIDQTLFLDPRITVLVGRNDVGKTKVLDWLLEQHYSVGGGYGGARSRLPDIPESERRVEFALTWQVEKNEAQRIGLPALLGVEQVRAICVRHDMMRTGIPVSKRPCAILINNQDGDYYAPPDESGARYLSPNAVKLVEEVLPKVRYIPLAERQLMPFRFEFRLFDPPSGISGPASSRRDDVVTEQVLLEMTGWRAHTRWIPGTPRPWDRPHLSEPLDIPVEELNRKLEEISQAITDALRKWWRDPEGLTFKMTTSGHRDSYGSYAVEISIVDQAGLPCSGTGLRWFLAFLMEVMDIQRTDDKRLLLFDEPANHLHPSAQKIVLLILNQLSERNQIIYSTHSPFMIDWAFPQRVRLLERDSSRRTRINNRPYTGNGALNPWDQTRVSIGVTLGDIGLLGDKNILVEGVSDHVLLANISAHFRAIGRPCLPEGTAIVPIGANENELKRVIQIAQTEGRKLLFLHDADKGGEELGNIARRKVVPRLSLRAIVSTVSAQDAIAIEDLFEPSAYLEAVNEYYKDSQGFNPPFAPISEGDLNRDVPDASQTITSRLEAYFKGRFSEAPGFSKGAVAVQIAAMIADGWQENGLGNFERLISQLQADVQA